MPGRELGRRQAPPAQAAPLPRVWMCPSLWGHLLEARQTRLTRWNRREGQVEAWQHTGTRALGLRPGLRRAGGRLPAGVCGRPGPPGGRGTCGLGGVRAWLPARTGAHGRGAGRRDKDPGGQHADVQTSGHLVRAESQASGTGGSPRRPRARPWALLLGPCEGLTAAGGRELCPLRALRPHPRHPLRPGKASLSSSGD